ncbi:hypothetical protein CEXT_286371 [Caerostris extrusa]|uniref:Uncharacterized protein n=1 Tax=Caerostris extrusa TaxID=172846 RepID=A0AAV4S3A7_CAEEX|nr:hypothetical protein CEXT_286371 [Caerostris extrusa]
MGILKRPSSFLEIGLATSPQLEIMLWYRRTVFQGRERILTKISGNTESLHWAGRSYSGTIVFSIRDCREIIKMFETLQDSTCITGSRSFTFL